MGQNRNGERLDNRTLLLEFKRKMLQEMPLEERKKYEQGQNNKPQINRQNVSQRPSLSQREVSEFNKRKPLLYKFLAGYKQNSGIFINNFFRKRDFETYCEDKFEMFTLDPKIIYGSSFPNVFDDPIYSFKIVGVLGDLDYRGIAYYPINSEYIEQLINFSRMIELSRPLEEDRTFFRGCTNLERNGVNGVVSVSSNYKIAEQFSRGTILAIDIPKGTRMLNVNAVRPREQRRKDFEQEYLLPPCDCVEIGRSIKPRANEPNNRNRETVHIRLKLSKTLDLLGEFLKVMRNPPLEFKPYMAASGDVYEEAVMKLEKYIQFRSHSNVQK